jgi:hypothetical protein
MDPASVSGYWINANNVIPRLQKSFAKPTSNEAGTAGD